MQAKAQDGKTRKMRTAMRTTLAIMFGAASPRRARLGGAGRERLDLRWLLPAAAKRAEPEGKRVDAAPLDSTAEAVRAAAAAIALVAPASARASAFGRPVRIAVGDLRVAAILRAALTETQKTRVTDRLVEIVVEPSRPAAAPV
jgi:hypothetical protein